MTSAAYVEVEKQLLGRWPEHKIDPAVERIAALVDVLGEPHKAAPVIHLTGTNGKSSTARMIDALLTAFGLGTGRFTSPHVEAMRERISLGGEPISEERFVQTFREIEPFIDIVDADREVPLSFFEVLTAMAFAAFADAPVDAAILEVGMGGRWDATNVANALVSVVTPIATDHTKYLGESPAEIAVEKAGIIKPGGIAVLAQQDVDVAQVLHERAAEVGASVTREGLEFGVLHRDVAVGGQLLTLQGVAGVYEDVFVPLHGEHQAHNAACALAAVEAFLAGATGAATGATEEGEGLDIELVREGFGAVSSPARLEVVRHSPAVVLDAAHNPHGAHASAEAVGEAFSFSPLIGVIGVMEDKDVEGVLEAFEPVMAKVVCTQNSTARAMRAAELGEIAEEIFGEDRVQVAPRLDDAIELGTRLAEEEATALGSGGVLITGSVITAGEARVLFGEGSGSG